MNNPSRITFTIGEEEITLIFNIASLNAMSKVLFGNQAKSFDMAAILAEINKVNEDNFWFACKAIIYSGVVGYYLESGESRPKYTFAEIGKLVGSMSESELIEYTTKVWEAFLNDLGINLEAIKEQEESEQGEKKK